MWIKTALYEEAVKKQAEWLGIAGALQARVISQQATMDWMMVRLTQLEHERAQLISNYMGIKVAVPEFAPPQTRPTMGADILSDIPSFQDVGDDEAKKLGLSWDDEGRATQHGKVIT